MKNPTLYACILLIVVLLIYLNALMSREIYNWIPTLRKKVSLWVLVWTVPVFGIFLANKLGNIGWFKGYKSQSGSSSVAGGFMEADSVFNPGVKNRIEMVEKQKSEIHHEHMQADGENTRNT